LQSNVKPEKPSDGMVVPIDQTSTAAKPIHMRAGIQATILAP
jgi:hypothetical protein